MIQHCGICKLNSLTEARRQHVEVVLDPQGLELATPVGFSRRGMAELPWAVAELHTPTRVAGSAAGMARSIAEYAAERPITAVLAPTHYLPKADSEWLSIDADIAGRLRRQLDAVGRNETPIYYPLAVHADLIRDPGFRRRVMEALRSAPVDAI